MIFLTLSRCVLNPRLFFPPFRVSDQTDSNAVNPAWQGRQSLAGQKYKCVLAYVKLHAVTDSGADDIITEILPLWIVVSDCQGFPCKGNRDRGRPFPVKLLSQQLGIQNQVSGLPADTEDFRNHGYHIPAGRTC